MPNVLGALKHVHGYARQLRTWKLSSNQLPRVVVSPPLAPVLTPPPSLCSPRLLLLPRAPSDVPPPRSQNEQAWDAVSISAQDSPVEAEEAPGLAGKLGEARQAAGEAAKVVSGLMREAKAARAGVGKLVHPRTGDMEEGGEEEDEEEEVCGATEVFVLLCCTG